MNSSIIIPAWEEEEVLPATLSRLELIKVQQPTEVIIIAGGKDRTFEIAKEWGCEKFSGITTIRQEPSDGKEEALRKGISEASGEYLLLLDADILVPEDWLMRVTDELQVYDAVSCDYAPREDHWIVSTFYFVRGKYAEISSVTPGLAGAGTIGVRKDVITDIGINNIFTSRTTAGDDFYLHKILSEQGRNIGKVRDVTVETILPKTSSQFVRRWARLHTVRYDINDDRVQLMQLFARSSAVVCSPLLLVIGLGLLALKRTIRAYLSLLALLIIIPSSVLFALFLIKIARRYRIVLRESSLTVKYLPAYAIAEYFYHVGRVIAYLQRASGFSGKVDHHFKREGG